MLSLNALHLHCVSVCIIWLIVYDCHNEYYYLPCLSPYILHKLYVCPLTLYNQRLCSYVLHHWYIYIYIYNLQLLQITYLLFLFSSTISGVYISIDRSGSPPRATHVTLNFWGMPFQGLTAGMPFLLKLSQGLHCKCPASMPSLDAFTRETLGSVFSLLSQEGRGGKQDTLAIRTLHWETMKSEEIRFTNPCLAKHPMTVKWISGGLHPHKAAA